MNHFKKLSTRLILITLVISLAFLQGCSSSKGKKGSGDLSEADLAAQREGRFGSGSIPTAEGEGLFRDIRFATDSSQISESSRMDIEANVEVLKEHANWTIQLEGHCDERDTAEYNMSLGEQRARAVKQVLVSLGVSSSKITTISYGEEVPLDSSGTEAAFAKNRRVHFAPTAEGR